MTERAMTTQVIAKIDQRKEISKGKTITAGNKGKIGSKNKAKNTSQKENK